MAKIKSLRTGASPASSVSYHTQDTFVEVVGLYPSTVVIASAEVPVKRQGIKPRKTWEIILDLKKIKVNKSIKRTVQIKCLPGSILADLIYYDMNSLLVI